MQRRTFTAALAATAAMLVAPAARAQRAGGAPPEAEAFVTDLTRRGIAELTGRGLAADERARRFRALLVGNFDVPTIGRFALGRYWRTASETERGEYMQLFETLLVATYSSRLGDYAGEQVRVTGSRTTAEGDVIVTSDVTRPQQPAPIKIDWVLRREANAFKIVDVRVEGVSMAITQRDEFAAIIQRGGGQVPALLQSLRQRTALRG